MKAILVLSAALAFSSPAAAQINTNCQPFGAGMNCATTDTMAGARSARAAAEAAAAAARASSTSAAQQTIQRNNDTTAQTIANMAFIMQRDRAARVGALLSAGDCAGAVSLALKEGDVALAAQAKTFCAAPAPK